MEKIKKKIHITDTTNINTIIGSEHRVLLILPLPILLRLQFWWRQLQQKIISLLSSLKLTRRRYTPKTLPIQIWSPKHWVLLILPLSLLLWLQFCRLQLQQKINNFLSSWQLPRKRHTYNQNQQKQNVKIDQKRKIKII